MPLLYIDIETIPGQAPWVRDLVASKVSHPASMSKPETIAKWEAEQKDAAIEEKWLKTSFDGALGEIVSIAWAIDDGDVQVVCRDLEGSEAEMIAKALRQISDSLTDSIGRIVKPTWIGHNLTGLDIRFIWQRCVINKVRPYLDIPVNAKPWGNEVFDTMVEWSGGRNGGGVCSMNDVCLALGFDGKGDMDGSQVWPAMKEGRHAEVAEYNRQDVERTRLMYKRMRFID